MSIAILDYGSQYTQLIARRVRELQIYCEMFPWDVPMQEVLAIAPQGLILSGGPASVYENSAPGLPSYVLESKLPILGICYGMQLLVQELGGKVALSSEREYGLAEITTSTDNFLLPTGTRQVWMSHGDRVVALPPGFDALAASESCPIAAIGDCERRIYGLQFHPEVHHTPGGLEILRHFAVDVCGAPTDWTPKSIIQKTVKDIQRQVGGQNVLAAVSGGVDSNVAAALAHKALGKQLSAVFVDNGLLRQGERDQVEKALRAQLGSELHIVDASQIFLSSLENVTDPEKKRRIIGETFIRVFEAEAEKLGKPRFLVQGTIYPDVVESRAPERAQAQRIKTHHNVGGLPEYMDFKLVEPLRYLFKDEVRAVGETLGLSEELVWRQPFPGPGLAVRCLGSINETRLAKLRAADFIFRQELIGAGLLNRRSQSGQGIAQAFAVLLPIRSVGVMGDQRTYQEVIALRAVTSQDFMTADWARLPQELLARTANRIVNEVAGVNRVVYDITSKPPATIEWE
ncbi:MAG: glutamine-hydrolyzing GMP synthase [Anaerolineaceae bacterium]|nr:glutamine-hydrolyzing GMP synthase [Anaerolineaceae bacterium]